MTAAAQDFDASNPTSFTFWTEEHLRAADVDVVGHVNNNAIGVFLENGRVNLFMTCGEILYDTATRVSGSTTWVVRRLEIDFIREIRFPGSVRTGTRIAAFGNTSCTVKQGIYVDGECRVTATAIAVCFDPENRRAVPISNELRQALATHAP